MTSDAVSVALDRLTDKVKGMDVAIRGNGKLGINVRLDRLEQSQIMQGRLMWLVISATVTVAVGAIIARFI